MTVEQARKEGYIEYDTSYTKGYLSHKTDIENQQMKVAGGNRKGEFYYEKPCYHSSRYHYRVYMKQR